MNLQCQENAILQLKNIVHSDIHSILIEGPAGCGKSYLVKEFAAMHSIPDIGFVAPTVDNIRSIVQSCVNLENPVVLSIENLDKGQLAASYALLKLLEEPKSNVYVVVTCRNIKYVPDTIISRSSVISVNHPVESDLIQYAKNKDQVKYQSSCTSHIWKVVKSFQDIDFIYKLTLDQIRYFESLNRDKLVRDSVSNITWMLGHYPDNSETDPEFTIRYILCNINNEHIKACSLACLKELENTKIAKHAVLTRFVFECKYGGG